MNFKEAIDSWIFCGYETLRIRWERARAFVETDEDRETIQRIENQLRIAMAEDLRHTKEPAEVNRLVAQTNGPKYAGPVVADRFQVMEGFVSGTWYLADLTAEDGLHRERGRNSDIVRFKTRDDAEAYVLRFTEGSNSDIAGNGHGNSAGVSNMARKATAKAEAPKKAKAKTERAPVDTRKRAAKTEAPVSADGKRGRKVQFGGNTLAGRTRDLIMAGKLTEAKMFETLAAEFPGKTLPKNLVAHYHADAVKRGLNPPPIKGGVTEPRRRRLAAEE